MRDEELDLLHNAELKEAFDEFDKVKIKLELMVGYAMFQIKACE